MDLHANGGEKEGFDFDVMLNLGMPTAAAAPAQSGMSMSYLGSRTPPDAQGGAVPHGGPGTPTAARNGAAYPGVHVDVEPPLISSTHPAATWSGAAYTDWLAAHLYSSGGRPPHQAVHDGAPYPDNDGLIVAQLRSGAAPTAPWNAVACPGVLTAHLAPDVQPAAWAWNDVAYPAVAMALDTNAAEAGLGSQRPRHTATAAAATEQSGGGGGYYYHHHSGDMAAPFSAQVVADEPEDSDNLVKDSSVAQQDEGEVAGAVAEPVRGGGGLAGVGGQLGAAAMTLAVAGLTAGGEVNPSTALPLFLMLIAGVTLVTVRVVRG